MGDDLYQALLGDLNRYKDAMQNLMVQFVAGAEGEELERLTAIQTEMNSTFEAFSEIASAKDQIEGDIDDAKRDLSEAEADLEQMKEIYKSVLLISCFVRWGLHYFCRPLFFV